MFEIHVDETGQMIGSFLDYMVIYMVMLMVILVMLNMTLLAVMTVLMVFSATLGFKLTYEEIFTTFGVSASKFNYRGSSLENSMKKLVKIHEKTYVDNLGESFVKLFYVTKMNF